MTDSSGWSRYPTKLPIDHLHPESEESRRRAVDRLHRARVNITTALHWVPSLSLYDLVGQIDRAITRLDKP